MRCHKDFVEVENDDRSCLVPHDDESAEVERVGINLNLSFVGGDGKGGKRRGKGRTGGEGSTFETLWGCCGKVVEGDGDQGPPDGWCYEGKHTTDTKRARFRSDSTLQNDKLVSCLKLNCHGIRSRLGRSGASSVVGTQRGRKRGRVGLNYKEASDHDDGDEDMSEGAEDSGMEDIVNGSTGGSNGRKRARKDSMSKGSIKGSTEKAKATKAKTMKGKGKGKKKAEEGDEMEVDEEVGVETPSKTGSVRGRGSKAKLVLGPSTPMKPPTIRLPPSTNTTITPVTTVEPTSASQRKRVRPSTSKSTPQSSKSTLQQDASTSASTPASASTKKRTRPKKSKELISDSDEELAALGDEQRGRRGLSPEVSPRRKEAVRTRSLSRTRTRTNTQPMEVVVEVEKKSMLGRVISMGSVPETDGESGVGLEEEVGRGRKRRKVSG